MLSTPIINPPQSAILGVHATKDRAVVENGQIVIRPMNYLAMSYDHRIIDEHSHGEGHPSQADHVERPAEEREHEEGPHHTHGDRQGHDERALDVPQKHQEREDRERAAHEDVVADEPDRRVDVAGFVVHKRELQPHGPQPAIDVGHHDAELTHELEHVGPGLTGDLDGEVPRAEPLHDAIGLLGAQPHTGHVADIDRLAVPPRDDGPLDLLQRAKLPQRANDIPPLALPDITAGSVLILVGQGRPQVLDREVASREPLRIDDHLELVGSPPHHVGRRDAGHPLEPALDLVFCHPLERLDVDSRRHKGGELGVGGHEATEPKAGQVGRACRRHTVKLGGQLRVLEPGPGDGLGIWRGRAQDQPGDRLIVCTRGPDDRPVGVDRPIPNLLDPRVDLHEGLRHVGAHGKLELN